MNLITYLLKKIGYKLADSAKALLNKIYITNNTKIAKRLASIALCTGMAFSVVLFGACSVFNPTTQPDTGTEQGNNNNTNNNQNDNNTQNPDLSQYSKILQTVLTDEYYTNLADEYQNNRYPDSNKYGSIPYAFLESKGHNLSAIKSDELKCRTYAYIENDDTNTLYISVKAENKNSKGDYYSDYTVSYKLSDKEYNDLYMLHNNGYRQAAYFIQELSNVKKATLISSANIEIDTYENLKRILDYNLKNKFNNKNLDFDLVDVKDKNNISIFVRPHPSTDGLITKNCLKRGMDINMYNSGSPSYDNNIFSAASYITINNMIGDFNENSSSITYFSTQGVKNIIASLKV